MFYTALIACYPLERILQAGGKREHRLDVGVKTKRRVRVEPKRPGVGKVVERAKAGGRTDLPVVYPAARAERQERVEALVAESMLNSSQPWRCQRARAESPTAFSSHAASASNAREPVK